MSLTRLAVSLEGYEIGLSGAIPEVAHWSEPAMDRGILEFVSLLSGLVFKYGGRVVHGTHPALTPIILRQARLHGNGRERKPVTLVLSELLAKDYSRDQFTSISDIAEVVLTKQVGQGSADDADTRNQSLSALRRVLVDAQNVMVLVGGKLHARDGIRPGAAEELELASHKGMPRFLVAGLGGLAAELAKDVVPRTLLNALSEADNLALFRTGDVAACVSLIFNQLALSQELAQKAIQPIRWNPGVKMVLDHRDGSIVEESTNNISVGTTA